MKVAWSIGVIIWGIYWMICLFTGDQIGAIKGMVGCFGSLILSKLQE